MNKRELIEFVRQTIMSGDIGAEKEKYLHPLRIQYFISSAFNTLYYGTFNKNVNELDFYAKSYTGVSVLYDQARNIYYSELPKPVVQFPLQQGVRKVGTVQGKLVEFVPTTIQESDIVSGTILELLEKPIGYIVTGNRVEYRYFDPYSHISEVFMSLVVPFSDLSMTEWVAIPSGKDLDLINIVKQLILQRQPEDKQNDNV